MKNILKNTITLIAVIFGCTVASAQIELQSKIVDFMTYAPIEGASIYVQNTTIGTVSNVDGKFALNVPNKHVNDTLVISSIGFASFKTTVGKMAEETMDIFLEEDVASLDEIVITADPRPETGNEIILKALTKLEENLPEEPYLQKGFLRHKERNTKEYKWLIESAITLYDSSYNAGAEKNLRINVDEVRKSYDLRDVDSLYTYSAFLKNEYNLKLKSKTLRRDTIATQTLVDAIKWNDERVNGLDKLFKGKLNLIRNANMKDALLGDAMLQSHHFTLDTILVDDGRKLYKIKISKSKDYVGLDTPGIYNEGFEAQGWLYLYYDNYAFKRIEYDLVAASDVQKKRSNSLFGTQLNHKLIMTFIEFEDKMYPNYIYYETPKLVNAGDRSSDNINKDGTLKQDKNDFYYNTVQEILFTEIIQDETIVATALTQPWSEDIFSPQPYNKDFWDNYNVLLESEEENQLIKDLSRRAGLFKQ